MSPPFYSKPQELEGPQNDRSIFFTRNWCPFFGCSGVSINAEKGCNEESIISKTAKVVHFESLQKSTGGYPLVIKHSKIAIENQNL